VSGQRIHYVANGDTSIAYTVFGEGEIDVICVGGFVGHLEIFMELPQARAFFDRLGSFSRLIMFDKRGMGLSDRNAEYTIEGVAEDILAVLDATRSESAVVFGVSEGGAAATYFAANHPDRTRALVLYGTWAHLLRAPDNPAGIPAEAIHETAERMREQWGATANFKWWAPSMAGDRRAAEWWGRLLRAGSSPGALTRLMGMYEVIDVRPLLELVRVPTLVLWRDGDRLIPPQLSRDLAAGIPGARGVEAEGPDHLFFAGDAAPLLDEIEEFLTGSRSGRAPQRALATVLFTDIVSSTERAAAAGDSTWARTLAEHDRIARERVEAERGRLVKSTGDGVLASFDGPGRAIAAAAAMRDQLAPLGLEIRSGIHTGECEQLGDDLGGLAVHIGARVSSAAGAGEVLVSQTVRDLVVGSGLEFEERGTQVLKGVPGEWRLYAVSG
jgi:pimeloyl-ACP methyl ester carboxylesterase